MLYGIDAQFQQILEDEACVAAFDRFLPGVRSRLAANPNARTLSIRQIAGYLGGAIPQAALDALDTALKEIGKQNGGISPAQRERMAKYQKIAAADKTAQPTEATYTQDAIYPGQVWLDTSGKRIQAHAGAIFYEDGVYYWYGENKEHTDGQSKIWTWGIRVYSSTDLCNWTDRGLLIEPVLDDPESNLFPERYLDRPHIIKNEATGKYVCWIKLSGPEACFVILEADSLLGHYRIVRENYNPFGHRIGDFDLLADKDGTGWLFAEADHKSVLTMRLSEDYHEAVEEVAESYPDLKPPFCREGVCVLEHEGRKYMVTSGMTGYIPNQSDAAETNAWTEAFQSIGDPHEADGTLSSFNSQISKIIPVEGKENLYLAMADRWLPEYLLDYSKAMSIRRVVAASRGMESYTATEADRKVFADLPAIDHTNTGIADYVFLPMTIENGKPVIRWRDRWNPQDIIE